VPVATGSSTRVFQAPQPSHLPIQRACSVPQLWQTYCDLAFATLCRLCRPCFVAGYRHPNGRLSTGLVRPYVVRPYAACGRFAVARAGQAC
jgi:hypothetical protein